MRQRSRTRRRLIRLCDTTGYRLPTRDYSQICAYRDLLWYNEARTD